MARAKTSWGGWRDDREKRTFQFPNKTYHTPLVLCSFVQSRKRHFFGDGPPKHRDIDIWGATRGPIFQNSNWYVFLTSKFCASFVQFCAAKKKFCAAKLGGLELKPVGGAGVTIEKKDFTISE